jgi:hypothetical protein
MRSFTRVGFGDVRLLTAGAACVLAVGFVPLAYMVQANAAQPLAPSANSAPETVASALGRCGLTAEALAAAGLDGPKAAAVRAGMAARLDTDAADLSVAAEAVGSARGAHAALLKSIQGEPNANEAAQLAQAAAAVATAESELASVVTEFRDAATESLTEAQRSTLATIRGNARWELPASYLVNSLDDESGVRLRDALAAERIALKLEEDVPPEAAGHLASVRADPAVAAALSNTASNLTAIRSALAGN